MGALTASMMALLCLATGAAMLAWSLRALSAQHLAVRRFREQLDPVLDGLRLKARGLNLMARLGRNVAGDTPVGALHAMLQQAGFANPATPFVFMGLRLLMALIAAAAALLPAWLKRGEIGARDAAFAFFFGFVVYRGFTILLKLRIENRQREIRREIPYVLDLLLMVLDSGISIDQALQHVATQIAQVVPISGQLLARHIADTEEGMPYDKALDRLAQRMAIPEGRDFAGLLKQNLFQGGELSAPLRRLAGDIGEARLAFAREQMGKKSVLLTLAMLAFFMPVLMIALAGPAVSDLVGTLSQVAQDMETQRMKP